MAYFINEHCVGCTACLKVCPTNAITGESKKLHIIDPALCIDCGACGIVCPEPAIYDAEGVVCERIKPKLRPKPVIEPELCTGCDYCVDICPFDCLEVQMDGEARSFMSEGVAVLIDSKGCVSCMLCEQVCDKEAIRVITPVEVAA